MNYFDMNFLNTIGITEVAVREFQYPPFPPFAAVFTGQRDHFHAFFTGRGNRFNHVTRVADVGS